MPHDLTFNQLQIATRNRTSETWPEEVNLPPREWMKKVNGEVMELQNEFLNENICYEAIAKEVADVITYLTLLISSMKLDTGKVVKSKFNEVSHRVGSKVRL